MSKSKGNAISPDEMMEKYGADAVRFYFYTSPVWYSKRFGFELVKDIMSKSITTLWNVYSFFVTNANLDGFTPSGSDVEDELDRWLLSRLNSLINEVRDGFDTYEIHRSGRAVMQFIDELSNWYLRRSRRRFWEGSPEEKKGAYEALYTALTTLSRLMSPMTPFLAETMYQNLVRSVKPDAPESVNMCDYPVSDPSLIDEELEKDMALVIKAVEAGRSARQSANIKLRMPLSEVIISGPESDLKRLERFSDVIKEELNVKEVSLTSGAGMMEATVSPNYGVLGPKFRARMKDAVKAIEGLSAEDIEALRRGETLDINGLEISQEDVIIVDKVKEGYSGAQAEGTSLSVLVNTEITDELRYEGLAREVVRRIQNMRKDMDLEYDARIETYYSGHAELEKAIETHRDYIMKETLSDILEKGEGSTEWKIEGMKLSISIKPRV
jgi:isoleucyl-tRNA synthetase